VNKGLNQADLILSIMVLKAWSFSGRCLEDH
jgi:hypothetical protein